MCLAALVLAAGCGSGGSGGSSYVPGGGSVTGDPSKYAEVTFLFPDTASKSEKMLRSVPEGTRFVSIYGSNSKGDVLYGPSEFRLVNTLTLPDVPAATTVFFLQFRDSRHEILSLYATDKLTLKAGGSAKVTVNNWEDEKHAPESMDVTIESSSIAAGYTTQCQAKINYGNGAVEAATELVDWKSSATSVATVNNSDSKGLVKGIAPGTADITA